MHAFWRTATGTEVDFLVEHAGGLVPVEAKAGATPHAGWAQGIASCQADLGPRVLDGWVLHTGDVRLPLAPRVTAVPFGAF